MKKKEQTLKEYSLKDLRKARGLSIEKLAIKLDIPSSTYRIIENGGGKNFSVTRKHIIANFFGIEMPVLFPEERERVEMIVGKQKMQMFEKKEK